MSNLDSDIIKSALESGGSQNQQLIFQLLLRELSGLRSDVSSIKTEMQDIQLTVSNVQSSVQNSERLWSEMRTMNTQVSQHEQSLFGAKGDNGMNGELRELKDKVEELSFFKVKAVAYTTVISSGLLLIKDFLFK